MNKKILFKMKAILNQGEYYERNKRKRCGQ